MTDEQTEKMVLVIRKRKQITRAMINIIRILRKAVQE